MSVGVRVGLGLAPLVGEDGDQPAVAGVEVEVALGGAVEVRLLEDEGHAEHPLPEVDRGLPVGADQRDVVHALALQLAHVVSSPHEAAGPVHQLRLVVAARQACRAAPASPRSSPPAASRRRPAIRAARSGRAAGVASTVTGSGGLCCTPRAAGRTAMTPVTSGAKSATTSRTALGKDVDAAHDQHVVGAADAAHPRAGAAAGAGRRPRPGRGRGCGSAAAARPRARGGCRRARPRRRRRTGGRRRSRGRSARRGRGRRRRSACRCGAAHSPQSETAMSPMPIASVTVAPQAASRRARSAGSPPPGSPATRRRRTLDAARSMPRASASSARCSA